MSLYSLNIEYNTNRYNTQYLCVSKYNTDRYNVIMYAYLLGWRIDLCKVKQKST